MPMQRYKPEQIVTVLRQIEVAMANGKSTPQACKEAGIHTQTYDRWRKEYGGLKVEQAKRLKALEKENTRLKRLVAELSLEKQVLQDVAGGTSKSRAAALCGGASRNEIRDERAARLPAAGAVQRNATIRTDGASRRGSADSGGGRPGK